MARTFEFVLHFVRCVTVTVSPNQIVTIIIIPPDGLDEAIRTWCNAYDKNLAYKENRRGKLGSHCRVVNRIECLGEVKSYYVACVCICSEDAGQVYYSITRNCDCFKVYSTVEVDSDAALLPIWLNWYREHDWEISLEWDLNPGVPDFQPVALKPCATKKKSWNVLDLWGKMRTALGRWRQRMTSHLSLTKLSMISRAWTSMIKTVLNFVRSFLVNGERICDWNV